MRANPGCGTMGMNTGRTVFSQLIDHVPGKQFQKAVARYHGDAHYRGFSCWDQYLAMTFAQLTYRESLRDIEACPAVDEWASSTTWLSRQGCADHAGRRQRVSRLAHIRRLRAGLDRHRPGHFYAGEAMGVDLKDSLYALDSTTIDLCLALFPWAKFRKHKGAVQDAHLAGSAWQHPHVLSALRTAKCMTSTSRRRSGRRAGAFYVMDRGYVRFRADCTASRSVRPFSSCAPNPTSSSSAATRIRWTRPQACAPITPSF